MLCNNGLVNKHRGGRQISPSTRGAISYAINVQDRHPLGEISNNQHITNVAESLHLNRTTVRRIAKRGEKRAREDSTEENLLSDPKKGRSNLLTKEEKERLWKKAISTYEWRHASWMDVAKV